jgi:hypothetical protein
MEPLHDRVLVKPFEDEPVSSSSRTACMRVKLAAPANQNADCTASAALNFVQGFLQCCSNGQLLVDTARLL